MKQVQSGDTIVEKMRKKTFNLVVERFNSFVQSKATRKKNLQLDMQDDLQE